MASLQQALEWAGRGFKVFPVIELEKRPAVAAFQDVATTDPAIVTAWWRDPISMVEKDYNIGVLTNDMDVVDIDLKRGKPGLESYASLGGHYETLVVKTPTNGYHCYFAGPDSRLLVDFLPGLDLRSHNGYVLAPGSYVIDPDDGIDGEYTLLVDKPLAELPATISPYLRAPGERRERERDDDFEYDTPTAIAQAQSWLQRAAPVAIEGRGGDNTTYQVAAKLVRDYALTLETAFALMQSDWNMRCVPPWDAGELWRKVENADDYAAGETGSARSEAVFGGVDIPAAKTLEQATPGLRFGNALDANAVPPRPWVIKNMLMSKSITLLAAAGGAGKSLVSLVLAAHMAVGRSVGRYVVNAPMRSVVFNAEDDLYEQTRRLLAICTAYQMDYDVVRANIMLIGTDDFPMLLAQTVSGQALANETHIGWLMQLVEQPDVAVLFLDPLIELHACNENDPVQMRFVMGILKRIAREGNVSILLSHHTSKPSGNKPRAGDIDTSRGSTAIPNAARVGLTLGGPSEDDRERLGISEAERFSYVRMDDGKQNLVARDHAGTWFRWQTVLLHNGDEVGVFCPVDMREKGEASRIGMAVMLREAIYMSGSGSISMQAACNYLQSNDDMYAKYTLTSLRRKVESNFTRPVKIDDDTIVVERASAGGRDSVMLRLM